MPFWWKTALHDNIFFTCPASQIGLEEQPPAPAAVLHFLHIDTVRTECISLSSDKRFLSTIVFSFPHRGLQPLVITVAVNPFQWVAIMPDPHGNVPDGSKLEFLQGQNPEYLNYILIEIKHIWPETRSVSNEDFYGYFLNDFILKKAIKRLKISPNTFQPCTSLWDGISFFPTKCSNFCDKCIV